MSDSARENWMQSVKAHDVSKYDEPGNSPEEVERRSELYRQVEQLRDECLMDGRSFDEELRKLSENPPAGYDVVDILEIIELLDMVDSMPDTFSRKKLN